MSVPRLVRTIPLPLRGALLLGVVLLLASAVVGCGQDGQQDADTGPEPTVATEQAAAKSPATEPDNTDLDDSPVLEVVQLEEPLVAPSEVAEELRIIWETWAILTRDFVERSEIDPTVISEGAINGMLQALGDPHTHYVSPQAFEGSQDTLHGEFQGIGAHVSTNRNGVVVIVAPIAGGPAEAAGIRPGDQILAVNGESIEGMSLLEAVSIIRGPEGTAVTLLVKHLGAIDPVEIEIIRGVIPLASVLVRHQPGDALMHIRLTNFYPETNEELGAAIREGIQLGGKGLVLDVRDNPGGLLSSVIDIAAMFLEEGLILYQVNGAGERTNWGVNSPGEFMDLPMVILANGWSASASEVLVGALQDQGRAMVIGETTFGKGGVNVLRPLSNGGGIVITTSRWYTPDGRLIQDLGVDPDIEVTAADQRDKDVKQLKRALEELGRIAGVPVSDDA